MFLAPPRFSTKSAPADSVRRGWRGAETQNSTYFVFQKENVAQGGRSSPVPRPRFPNWLRRRLSRNIQLSARQRDERRKRQESPMSWKATQLCLATIALAGGFALAAIGESSAENATNKCALEWKAAKANGTTGGKSWKEFFDQCGTDQNGLSRSIGLT